MFCHVKGVRIYYFMNQFNYLRKNRNVRKVMERLILAGCAFYRDGGSVQHTAHSTHGSTRQCNMWHNVLRGAGDSEVSAYTPALFVINIINKLSIRQMYFPLIVVCPLAQVLWGDPNAWTNQALPDTDDKFTKTTLWSTSFSLLRVTGWWVTQRSTLSEKCIFAKRSIFLTLKEVRIAQKAHFPTKLFLNYPIFGP